MSFIFQIAKDGTPLVIQQIDDKTFPLSSRSSPTREAQRVISSQGIDQEIDGIVLFGVGNIALIKAALDLSAHFILLVDSYQALLDFAKDQVELPSHKSVHWLTTEDIQTVKLLFQKNPTQKLKFIYNRAQLQLNQEKYIDFRKKLIQAHERKSINIATISRFEKLWLRNITQNTKTILDAHPVYQLFQQAKGKTAIIVGAGPSLSINLPILKKYQSKATIIAVDTIFKTLLKNEIIPDAVIIVDPQKINSKYVENTPDNLKTIYIAEPAVCPKSIRDKVSRLFLFDTIFPYYKYIIRRFGLKGELDLGGSVATTAIDFVKQCGFSQVAFCGMDFCYRNDSYHVPGTMYEEYWFSHVDRLRTYEMMTYKLLDYEKCTPITDIRGEPAFVDAKFTMFIQWINDKLMSWDKEEIEFFQCSEAGHSLKGTASISLQSFFDQYGQKDKFHFSLPSADSHSLTYDLKTFLEELKNILENIRNYKDQAQIGARLAKTAMRKKHHGSIQAELKQLQALDQKMEIDFAGKDFVNIVLQKIIHEITGKHTLHGDALEASFKLYQAILDAAELNIQALARVIDSFTD